MYVHDTYEFIDAANALFPQPLGVWSRDRCLSKAEMAAWSALGSVGRMNAFYGFYWVDNSDFNAYRAKRGLGGDFVVYSDIKRIKLAKPVKIKL